MQISIKQNIAAETGAIAERFARQLPFALARALTITATKARTDVQANMRTSFDRPTPWIIGSVRYEIARTDSPQARVYISPNQDKSGSTPVQTLTPQISGGSRPMKRFETAFKALGLMTDGEALVPAGGRTDILDKYGNIRSSLLVQLLAYFQAFGQQGYKANATAKRIKGIAKFGKTSGGYQTINGKVYFWSRGKGRWQGNGSWQHGREQHLARGIWEKSGIHGSNVKPVIMVVSKAAYRPRFDFVAVVKATVDREFQPAFKMAWADAVKTAR